MNQHTPGPWINDGDTVSANVGEDNSGTYIAPICILDQEWKPEMIAANARLIAAAPELLEALRAVVALETEPGIIMTGKYLVLVIAHAKAALDRLNA